ncbi:hypothetical protein DOTSEDRAFT_40990 [Dothistroma septosporum NZE10]|uniref:Glycoprotease family protein n=1 Tax=Dothistroma septosporum (strain NZE10 / CBS 128990) TaxID=675120 RepID=N1Q4R4_DOTSN|nr:hypothetical protein DOTSEDRAFT_40990 [Dothistroma septosporum NZE10]
MHTFTSNRRKSSQRNKRSRPFGKLTIDTNCASQGRTYPCESRVPGLSFVSFEESKARKNASISRGDLEQQLERCTPIHPGPKRTLPAPVAQLPPAVPVSPVEVNQGAAQDGALSRQDSLAVPLNRRIKGLRPSPLDLSNDVSPSDQITIGMNFSPSTVSNYTRTPNSPILPRSPDACPVIVITPAKENFSPEALALNAQHRPASSVYSRFTNCMPMVRGIENAPPVPPLPSSFVKTKAQKSWFSDFSRSSGITSFEEDLPSARSRPEPASTHCDVVYADKGDRQSTLSANALPTPRRSKGWWNVITSPFSAKSAGTSFWRSSPPEDGHDDTVPILGEVAAMGSTHNGLMFTNGSSDVDQTRSAPAVGPDTLIHDNIVPKPKRADTAPGALDMDAMKVNIYRIPSSGEAAGYYNAERHFPSLCGKGTSKAVGTSGDDAWSPSHSVFMPERDGKADATDPRQSTARSPAHSSTAEHQRNGEDRKIEGRPPSGFTTTPLPYDIAAGRNIFSTPSEEELQSAGLSRSFPKRNLTGGTITSQLPPLSATPIVQDAQMARFAGPQTAFGEQKQVQVEQQAPTPSHYGLGFATMGAATIDHEYQSPTSRGPIESEKHAPRPVHVRQDSYGLGISDAESELWPPPQPLCEKPRLGTDRFGQLTVRSLDMNKSARPWYHRFFWLLAAGISMLIILMIVLLVVFIPQHHAAMPVQASWVNLTGFPAMPIGISTVIGPEKTQARDGCVAPSNMWSCAPPDQAKSNKPNFRFEIMFRNGTLPKNETMAVIAKRWQDSSALHKSIRRSLWSEDLYLASPPAPSQKDQEFLGHDADNTSVPYNGEETPYYLSLLDPAALVSAAPKLRVRDERFRYPYPNAPDEGSSNASTTKAKDIPKAAELGGGKPVAQTLYPYASAQPLRLFDRGKDTEHYGFYTYFDRSIYVNGLADNVATNDNFTSNVALEDASAVCTFSQTRFLIQIWTRKIATHDLKPLGTPTPAANSTANDMTAPGSFPYAVTITLDRHGGSADKKGVYCYGLDSSYHIVGSAKVWLAEDRAAGGTIVNAAETPSPANSTTSAVSLNSKRSSSTEYSGIDGGTGGCNCAWQNWK